MAAETHPLKPLKLQQAVRKKLQIAEKRLKEANAMVNKANKGQDSYLELLIRSSHSRVKQALDTMDG